MIKITGDMHRENELYKLSPGLFQEQEKMTKQDYLIICGDFGGVWYGNERDNAILDWYEKQNYITLFCGGNHENWDALNAMEQQNWHGGLVHFIRPSVIHLMNGEIYEIEGYKFFVMGGASSVDKMYRNEGVNWWKNEEPSMEDYVRARSNLKKNDYVVDYVITHTIPKSRLIRLYGQGVLHIIGKRLIDSNVENFLDEILKKTKYTNWYAGHFHISYRIEEVKIDILYDQIEDLNLG